MDSLTTAQLLRDAQQFYSDSFQDLLTIFGFLVTIVAGWKIWDSYRISKNAGSYAKKEIENAKAEMEKKFSDFKVYTKIALAITKFRDFKPTKEDLEVFIKIDYSTLSADTVQMLVHAIRYCVDCLEDVDYELAKRVDAFVRPLAVALNADNRNSVYGVFANQILMRTREILSKEFSKT